MDYSDFSEFRFVLKKKNLELASIQFFTAEKDWKTEKLKSEKWKASYIKALTRTTTNTRGVFLSSLFYTNLLLEPPYSF